MILKLNNDLLHTECKKFDFNNPPMNPVELFQNLKETMLHHRGLGLSANQVGIPYAVFVMGNPDDPDSIFSVFNPKIVDGSQKDIVLGEEGCLSYPNLFVKVKRLKSIKARFSGHDGNVGTIKLDGWTARIFQHEFDHLIGKTFQQRASKFHLDQAKNKQKKIK